MPADTGRGAAAKAGATPTPTTTVPILAKGMQGIRTQAAPAPDSGPAVGSTVLGLFALSMIAAGASLLVAIRARARR